MENFEKNIQPNSHEEMLPELVLTDEERKKREENELAKDEIWKEIHDAVSEYYEDNEAKLEAAAAIYNERMSNWRKLMENFTDAQKAAFAKETKAIRNEYHFKDWDKKGWKEKNELNKKRRDALSVVFRKFGLEGAYAPDQGEEVEYADPSPDNPKEWRNTNNPKKPLEFDEEDAERYAVSYPEKSGKLGAVTAFTDAEGKQKMYPTKDPKLKEVPKENQETQVA